MNVMKRDIPSGLGARKRRVLNTRTGRFAASRDRCIFILGSRVSVSHVEALGGHCVRHGPRDK